MWSRDPLSLRTVQTVEVVARVTVQASRAESTQQPHNQEFEHNKEFPSTDAGSEL